MGVCKGMCLHSTTARTLTEMKLKEHICNAIASVNVYMLLGLHRSLNTEWLYDVILEVHPMEYV
jgi:hypothetical protein